MTSPKAMTSFKRSFKDRAKEKLGFGAKGKTHSVDVDSLGIMNPLSWDNLSSDIREKLTGETLAQKSDQPVNQPTGPPTSPPTFYSSELGNQSAPPSSFANTFTFSPGPNMFGPITDEDSGNNKVNKAANRKSRLIQPDGTVEYTIKNHDTLTSIAALYDTTPSELCKLNKLNTRFIFPGQVLYVPDTEYYSSAGSDSAGSAPTSPLTSSPANTKLVTSSPAKNVTSSPDKVSAAKDIPTVRAHTRHPSNSPKSPLSPSKGPGHAQRVESTTMTTNPEPAARPLSENDAQRMDSECLERFIKINVKHITDGQGVVSGTLLVTPNAIMFDPNVSDILVIEHGSDKYGMIAPMDTIISVAMYHDIAAMRLKSAPKDDSGNTVKHKVYHSATCPLARSTRSVSPQPCHAPTAATQDLQEPSSSEVNESKTSETSETSKTIENETTKTENSVPRANDNEIGSSEGLNGLTEEGLKDLCECSTTNTVTSQPPSGENMQQQDNSDDNSVSGAQSESETSPDGTPLNPFAKTVTFSDQVSTDDVKGTKNDLDDVINDVRVQRRYDSQDHGIGFLEDLESGPVAKKSDTDPPSPRKQESSGYFNQLSFSPNFSSFVDFSSGLFSASRDERAKVKDITEVETREPPTEVKELTTSLDAKSDSSLSFSPSAMRKLDQILDHPSSLDDHEIQDDNCPDHLLHEYDNIDQPDLLVDLPHVRIQKGARVPQQKGAPRAHHPVHAHCYPGGYGSHFITVGTGAAASWLPRPLQKISETVSGSMSPKTPPPTGDGMELPPETPKPREVAVESLVKLDDRPELFKSLDDLIPKPAQHYEDPPLYLCLKVGVPINKRLGSATCPIESYNKKRKKPEYWFSIPRDRVDHLYAFFIQWSPNLYGGEDEIDPRERGFVVIEDEEDGDEDEHVDFVKGRLIRSMSKDWEILNVAEARRRMSILDVEESLPLPELHGETAILNEEHVSLLTKVLPARAEGYPWSLIYSSDQNGFSLSTLYRSMQDYDCPVLLVIKCTSNNVFGALTSCSIKYSEHFYGTGESFLYTFYPEYKMYSWSGENNFFIKGNKDGLAIGAGKGSFGIWLDGDLYHGRTQHCDTYNNQPLTSQEDFVIKGLEAWGFY